jgi:hypothetical protein
VGNNEWSDVCQEIILGFISSNKYDVITKYGEQ